MNVTNLHAELALLLCMFFLFSISLYSLFVTLVSLLFNTLFDLKISTSLINGVYNWPHHEHVSCFVFSSLLYPTTAPLFTPFKTTLAV